MEFLIGCALLFLPPILFTFVWMFIFRRSTDSEHGGYDVRIGPIVTTANEVSRGEVRGRRVFFLSLILYWGTLFLAYCAWPSLENTRLAREEMNEATSATPGKIAQFADAATKSNFDDFCHSGYKYFLCLTHRQNYNALENVAFRDGKRYLFFSTGYPAWFDAGDIADTKLGLGTRWTSFKTDFLSARAAIREAAKQGETALGNELAKLENLIVQFKKNGNIQSMHQYSERSQGLFDYSADLQIAAREFKHSASIEANMKKLQYDRVKNCAATNTCKPTRSWLTQ